MMMEDILVIKGNVAPSPNGDSLRVKALDRLEDFGGNVEVDGKGGNPNNLRVQVSNGFLDPAHWRATELNIF